MPVVRYDSSRRAKSGARERSGSRASPLRKLAKRAGLVVLALIALDLVAGVATVALGAEFLKR